MPQEMPTSRKVVIPWLLVAALSAVIVWREVPRLFRGHLIRQMSASKDGAEELAALARMSVLFPVVHIGPVSPLRSLAELAKEPSSSAAPNIIELRWSDGYTHDYQVKDRKNLLWFIRE